jgi:acyl dehydratase
VKHPTLGIANRFDIPDCPERVHWDAGMARRAGAPGAYDYGPERCAWMSHAITNWVGDDAQLRRRSVEIRRHNLEGELLTIDGEVTAKRTVEGRNFVDFALAAHNQDGELWCRPRASAELFVA